MNELLETIKAQIIFCLKSKQGRVTKDLLQQTLAKWPVFNENNRGLTQEEKNQLDEKLRNYYVADLNYDSDLVELERGIVIRDPSKHEEWEPNKKNRFYWKKQREFLMKFLELRNTEHEISRIINSIDFETETILNNIEDPAMGPPFDSRGLVLGYVQSGKTANFTGLISKSADAGYRFIIVLAGIHDELRQQTQIRLDRELTGHNNLNLGGNFIEWNAHEEHRRWINLTSAGWLEGKETGEFSGKGINKFKDVFLNENKPVLAVIKKNVKIMDRLIKWISNSEEHDRVNTPVLIIDDEADQASVDGNANNNNSETNPTKTNARIRSILAKFNKSAYIGYTATPFANVFIKHDTKTDGLGDDLYPRNFIHSLPEPAGYFGTRKIFLNDLDNLFVKLIKDTKKQKKELVQNGSMTEDLLFAIYEFIIGIAIRNLRGHHEMPMSMMINVDHRVTRMNRIGAMLDEYLYKTLPGHTNYKEIEIVYKNFIINSEKLNNMLSLNNIIPTWEKVQKEIFGIINSRCIKISVLNSGRKDKLDYAKDPSMKVIAVGGNKLSRGLTLEGLMLTYYLRESKQYDTLLQMGRWFGYRKNYEDLVRIYTNQTLWTQFKDLAIVELDFRQTVQEMLDADPPKTPKEFAIAVRHILGLLPTARNKLGAAQLQSNYSGSQVSVTRLMLGKPTLLDENMTFTVDFINKLISNATTFQKVKSSTDLSSLITFNASYKIVIDFLHNFHIALEDDQDPKSILGFDKLNLLNYLKKKTENNNLLFWNVSIISTESENIINLPSGIQIGAVNRSRLKLSPINGAYNIKALNSRSDRQIDLPPDAKNEYDKRELPLLLLYFVSRNSIPMLDKERTCREKLYQGIDTKHHRDPVAYSIIFPPDHKAPGVFIQDI